MKIQKLAERTIESLADNRQDVGEFIEAFRAEAHRQALRAAKEGGRLRGELEYWAQVERETRPAPAKDPRKELQQSVRNFLTALRKEVE